jgi:hypothetical protein
MQPTPENNRVRFRVFAVDLEIGNQMVRRLTIWEGKAKEFDGRFIKNRKFKIQYCRTLSRKVWYDRNPAKESFEVGYNNADILKRFAHKVT